MATWSKVAERGHHYGLLLIAIVLYLTAPAADAWGTGTGALLGSSKQWHMYV